MTGLVALVGLTLLLVAAEVALGATGHFPPGTLAAGGFVGALAIAGIARGAARAGLQRPEPRDDA
jgi:hypothetical protein